MLCGLLTLRWHDAWGSVWWYLLVVGIVIGMQYAARLAMMFVFVRIGWMTPEEAQVFMQSQEDWLEPESPEDTKHEHANDEGDG